MAVRTITTQLALDGEKEFKREMSEANSQLKTLRTETQKLEEEFRGQANTTEYLTKKSGLLRDEIAQQDEKVRALRGALEDAAAAYGETDKRTDAFRQQLNRAETDLIKMNRELKDTEKYLKEAEDSADGAAKSIDGFGKEVKDVDGADQSIGDLVKQFGDLKNMILGGAIVTGIKEFTGAVLELEESTREYRQIMGTLEATTEQWGYGVEETKDAYKRLYGVLGDDQATATTLQNLMAIDVTQEELLTLIDQTTGAWAMYGDSIPIDGLAEAINETIKAGQVTGTFADVLNWGSREGETFGVTLKENIEFTELSKKELEKLTDAQKEEYEATKAQYDAIEEYNNGVQDAKTAEDKFNIALQNTTSEQERLELVMETLASQGLASLGETWRDVNGDIVEANESQMRMNEAMGRLGETVAPLADGIRELGADAIDWLVDKIEDVIPMLEGMAEVATKVWDAVTGGEDRDVYRSGQYGSRSVDGSHAGGLNYVPFDGYRAELHEGERIQTRAEADWWRSAQQPLPGIPQGVTAAQMQAITAAAVNATNLNRGREQIVIEAKWVVNGREFYADTIEDFRAVNRSNPEVADDR